MEYVIKIATLDEIIKRMDYLIETHPGNNIWVVAKENAIRGYHEGSKIMYIGILDGEIISEATAYIKEEAFVGDIKDTENLLLDERVYLSAFRTNPEYRGQGYFSKLFKFMENDLKSRGYKEMSLGVEPCEVKNMMIYFNYGFTNYIKTNIEYLPAKDEFSKPIEEFVNYYYKRLGD